MISLRRMSLRGQVVVASAVLMMVLTGILAVTMEARFAHRMEGEIGRNLADASRQIAVMLRRSLDFHGRQLATTASAAGLLADDPDALRRLLHDVGTAYPDFAWLAFMGPDGAVRIASDARLEGQDFSGRTLFRQGREAAFVGELRDDVRLADPLRRPMRSLDMAVPVDGPDGTRLGVLGAAMGWSWAEDLVSLALSGGPGAVEVFIAAPDGRLLLAPPQWMPDRLPASLLAPPEPPGESWRIALWPGGAPYLTAWARLGPADHTWTVLARQPARAAYAPVRDLTRDIWLYGLLLAALFSWLAWLAASRLSAPLARIAQAADRIRGGEPTEIPAESGPREIASLSASLRALVHSLTDHEMRLGHMQRLAHQDPLTGLLNRAGFRDRVATMLRKARRRGDGLACLYLDLDGFKPINDTLGHAAGDQVLREVAHRLTNVLREGDEVARLGGDEFALLSRVQTMTADDQARIVADRALAALGGPIAIDGHRVRIGCSIGIAIWPQDAEDFQEVRQMADEALYAAKKAGKNRAHFHPRHDQAPPARLPRPGRGPTTDRDHHHGLP